MKPCQQRALNEHAELRDRLQKLSAFIADNPDFAELHLADQRLLFDQQDAMSVYEAILARRIARFTERG